MSARRWTSTGRPGSRPRRRLAVAAVVLLTAVVGSLAPPSLHGFGTVAVLVLAALDIVLIHATGGIAFSRGMHLDERERALRDFAYRRGFRLLGLAAALEIALLIATGIIAGGVRGQGLGLSAVNNGITGRALVGLAELLLMTPTMVVAWVEPQADGDGTERGRGAGLAWLALPLLAGAWLGLLALGPEQVVGASATSSVTELQGATCAHFAGGRMVDSEFGATVGMRVEVCWNGHDAFVFGNPAIPLPPSAIAGLLSSIPAADRPSVSDASMFNGDFPDASGCGLDNTDDFATVSATTCTGEVDESGTLHYLVRATVSGPLGVGRRDVVLTLVVDRTGRVLQRP